MSGYLVKAQGAPCPTLVLDGERLPDDGPELLGSLARIRAHLSDRGAGDVLKHAIIRPSAHPLFDLDYRFVQALPHGLDAFDLRGSCGHSILAAVEAAGRGGMIRPLAPGGRVRVNVLNNDDNVVCEVEATSDRDTRFTAHFLCTPSRPFADLLTTGDPVTEVAMGRLTIPVSLVSMGNPYVFVAATSLGLETRAQLFADDLDLLALFRQVRLAVCEQLGWDAGGAFPKVAVLLAQPSGALAVRAVSVPSWHPTIALTGAICLGTAVGIEGTVPWSLARAGGHGEGLIRLETPGGPVQVAATAVGPPENQRLTWVSVAGKYVAYRGQVGLPAEFFTPSSKERICLSAAV